MRRVDDKHDRSNSTSEASKSEPSEGRLVWNHSTHLPGLIPILKKLTQYPGIQTITPGVIGNVRAHAPHLKLKVSVPIRGGYKTIARHGKTVQEVFILTTLSQPQLEAAIGSLIKSKS